MTALEKDLMDLVVWLTDEARYVDLGHGFYSNLDNASDYINGHSAKSYIEARDRLTKIMVKHNLCCEEPVRPLSDVYRKIRRIYFGWDLTEQQRSGMLTNKKLLKQSVGLVQK